MGYVMPGLALAGYGNGGAYTVAAAFPRISAPSHINGSPRVFAMDVCYAQPWTPPYDSFYTEKTCHRSGSSPDGGNVQTPDGSVLWLPATQIPWPAGFTNNAGRGHPKGYYEPIEYGLQSYGYAGNWFNGLELLYPNGTSIFGGSGLEKDFGY